MADSGFGGTPSEGDVTELIAEGEGFEDLAFTVTEGDGVDMTEDFSEVGDVIWGREVGSEEDLVDVVESWFVLGLEHPAGEGGFASNFVPDLASDTDTGIEGEGGIVASEARTGIPQADAPEVL